MTPYHLCFATLCAAAVPCQGPQFVVDTPPTLATLPAPVSQSFDADGDGDLDLIALRSSLIPLALVRNDGGGRFVDVTATALPPILGAGVALPLDIDMDGDLDLFVGGGVSPLRTPSLVLRNDGAGTFALASTLSFVTAPVGAAASDLDGDGDQDLVVTGSALVSSLDMALINDGSGQFSMAFTFGLPLVSRVALSDLDGDGDDDVLLARTALTVFRNDGGFAFTDVTATAVVIGPSVVGAEIAVGDLDSDGDEDVLLFGGRTSSVVVLDNRAGVLTSVGSLPGGAADALALADVDGDGDLDVARQAAYGAAVELLLNDGRATFSLAPTRVPAPFGRVGSGVWWADLDGDRDPELLVGGRSGTVVLRNRDVDLEVPTPNLGQPWPLAMASRPGYAASAQLGVVAVGLRSLTRPLAVPGVGDLWLDVAAPYDSGSRLLPSTAGTAAFGLAIPAVPSLAGTVLHVQGFVGRAPDPVRLTSWRTVTIR